MSLNNRVFLVVASLWTIFTVLALGVITALIITAPAFSLGLGWIRTRGLSDFRANSHLAHPSPLG